MPALRWPRAIIFSKVARLADELADSSPVFARKALCKARREVFVTFADAKRYSIDRLWRLAVRAFFGTGTRGLKDRRQLDLFAKPTSTPASG